MKNSATLDVTKSSFETVIFSTKEMLSILDLRSIGYYKIKHGVLQQTWVNILDLNQQMYTVSNLINLQMPWRRKKRKQMISIYG